MPCLLILYLLTIQRLAAAVHSAEDSAALPVPEIRQVALPASLQTQSQFKLSEHMIASQNSYNGLTWDMSNHRALLAASEQTAECSHPSQRNCLNGAFHAGNEFSRSQGNAAGIFGLSTPRHSSSASTLDPVVGQDYPTDHSRRDAGRPYLH